MIEGQPRRETLVKTVKVTKSFGGTLALSDVSLTVSSGRVLAVLGENGAGKTTLMNVLAGVVPHGSYEGAFQLSGEECHFSNVHDAREAGIVLIPQELHIAPELSIAENMFSGDLPARWGRIDWSELRSRALAALRSFGMELDPFLLAKYLSPSEQRLAVIAAYITRECQLLILDEPTASLSEAETEVLFRHLTRLRDEGIGIILITHRLDDVSQIADEVAILRNGRLVARHLDEVPGRQILVQAMIGRAIQIHEVTAHAHRATTPVLEVRHLSAYDPLNEERRRVDDVSFDAYGGEVLGLFGLVGAGRSELAHAIYGLWRGRIEGSIVVDGEAYSASKPKDALRRGIGYLGEDRKEVGIFHAHSVRNNMTAAVLDQLITAGFLNRRQENKLAAGVIEDLDVRPQNLFLPVEALSGGNQQKALVGRWVLAETSVLFLDEPTIGVDIGAREEIYREISRLAGEGRAIICISSDLDEVLKLCDRILVMYKGRIVENLTGTRSRHSLMAAATGAA